MSFTQFGLLITIPLGFSLQLSQGEDFLIHHWSFLLIMQSSDKGFETDTANIFCFEKCLGW